MMPLRARAPFRRRDRRCDRGPERPAPPGGGAAARSGQGTAAAAHPRPGARVGGLVRIGAPGRGAQGGRHGRSRRPRGRGADARRRGDASEHARGRRRRVRTSADAGERRLLMAVDIRFLGQSCIELKAGGATVLTDPFLTGNPLAAATADEVEPDVILLTHGHSDHLGDTVDIAKRTGATVLAIVELANEIAEAGVENVMDPNFGGTVKFDWGWVKLVPAWHTAVSPSGTAHMPAGLLIHIGDRLVYHLGDTCLFSDMQLIARRGDKVDLALVPIGGHYTMDRFDAVTAVELINPSEVIPCHYNTFPPIEADAQAFKSDVQNAGFSQVVVLEPGGTHKVK